MVSKGTNAMHTPSRLIKISFPHVSTEGVHTKVSTTVIPLSKSKENIYDSVSLFEKNRLRNMTLIIEPIIERALLTDIINLHNDDGIRDTIKIKEMARKIRSGSHILKPNDLPNIKLVKSTSGDYVLFDGHHSMLSYLSLGKVFLDELPYLFIVNQEGYVSDEEILVFFGEHSHKIPAKNWKDFVINWQASHDEQLCFRRQRNMGELFDSLSSLIRV